MERESVFVLNGCGQFAGSNDELVYFGEAHFAFMNVPLGPPQQMLVNLLQRSHVVFGQQDPLPQFSRSMRSLNGFDVEPHFASALTYSRIATVGQWARSLAANAQHIVLVLAPFDRDIGHPSAE